MAEFFRARKRFGQHFLHDPGVIARIVAAFDPRPGECIAEIGPGRGALTRPLLARAGRLHVVELDRDLAAALPALVRDQGELAIHSADALRFDFRTLCPGQPVRVIGNLPYNISTPLFFHLLEQSEAISDMLFMVQKEVAERMAAPPGGKDYGRLSVMLQWRFAVEHLFDVGSGAFTPPPRVDSSIVRLVPLPPPAYAVRDSQRFARLVQAAFSQRRKTLRNALRGLATPEELQRAGIDPDRRAETVSTEEYRRLSDVIAGSEADV